MVQQTTCMHTRSNTNSSGAQNSSDYILKHNILMKRPSRSTINLPGKQMRINEINSFITQRHPLHCREIERTVLLNYEMNTDPAAGKYTHALTHTQRAIASIDWPHNLFGLGTFDQFRVLPTRPASPRRLLCVYYASILI